MGKQSNRQKGIYGENIAQKFLLSKEYNIVETNYRVRFGEIDIIAIDQNCLVFVEVKYRTSLAFGFPREAVTYKKQEKIRKTAQFYILQKNINQMDIRFDVIDILEIKPSDIAIEHIQNAF